MTLQIVRDPVPETPMLSKSEEAALRWSKALTQKAQARVRADRLRRELAEAEADVQTWTNEAEAARREAEEAAAAEALGE